MNFQQNVDNNFQFHTQENGVDFESRVVAQIDEVIASLEEKKSELILSIGSRVENKLRLLNDQKGECSEHLQIMTGLLDYVDKVCEEDDPAVFLLISNSISSRFDDFFSFC